MGKFILFISILFCLTSLGFSEESQGQSQQIMESIQQQLHEMSELGIPEDQAQKMLTLMVQNRFQRQNRILARKVVMETARAGLPTEPVISKAIEGMAKKVREQNIIAAMEAVHSRYAYANQLAGSLSDDKENTDTMVMLIADSLAAGMRPKDMEAVTAQLRTQVQVHQQAKNQAEGDQLSIQTWQTIRTMARLGVRSSDVSNTLCQALQKQSTHQEIKLLRHQITKQNEGFMGGGNPGNSSRSIGGGGSSGSGGSSNSGGSSGSGGSSSSSGSSGSGGSSSSGGSGGSGGSGNNK